jgi:hypothetical protein
MSNDLLRLITPCSSSSYCHFEGGPNLLQDAEAMMDFFLAGATEKTRVAFNVKYGLWMTHFKNLTKLIEHNPPRHGIDRHQLARILPIFDEAFQLNLQVMFPKQGLLAEHEQGLKAVWLYTRDVVEKLAGLLEAQELPETPEFTELPSKFVWFVFNQGVTGFAASPMLSSGVVTGMLNMLSGYPKSLQEVRTHSLWYRTH